MMIGTPADVISRPNKRALTWGSGAMVPAQLGLMNRGRKVIPHAAYAVAVDCRRCCGLVRVWVSCRGPGRYPGEACGV